MVSPLQLRQRIFDAARIGDDPALRTAVNEAMASGIDPHSGYESCILTLVEFGADVLEVETDGETLIHRAARGDHESIVRTLVAMGVDPNRAANNGMTPCHIAVLVGSDPCLKTLMELGANASQANNYGSTPSAFANNQNIRDLIAATIARCVALQDAARDGTDEEVRRLIHHEHTSIVHTGAHAADAALANGHDDLAARLRELWPQIVRAGGYDRHNALQAQRARWVILRDRFTKRSARRNFAQAAMSDRERRLLDWLLVGTSDICPDDPFSVIMGYWTEQMS